MEKRESERSFRDRMFLAGVPKEAWSGIVEARRKGCDRAEIVLGDCGRRTAIVWEVGAASEFTVERSLAPWLLAERVRGCVQRVAESKI